MQNFEKKITKILQNFYKILQNLVDFEKCWKMLSWMQKFVKILLKFDKKIDKIWEIYLRAARHTRRSHLDTGSRAQRREV